MKKIKRYLSNTYARTIFVSLVTVIFGFVSGIFLARILGPESRGEFASIVLMTTLIATFSQMGLGNAYVYFKRKEYQSENISILFYIGFFVNVALVFFIVFCFLDLIKNNVHVIFFICLTTILTSLTVYTQLDRELKNYNNVKIISSLVVFFGYGFLSIFIGSISTSLAVTVNIISLSICIFMTVKVLIKIGVIGYPQLNADINYKSYFGYAFKLYLTMITGVFVSNFDKVFMFINGTFESFGIYAVAYSYSRLIGVIPQQVSTVIFSKYAGIHSDDAGEKTIFAYQLLFFPLILLAVIISTVSYYIIPHIYGADYAKATIPIMILLFECVISSMSWILSQRFAVDGRPGLILVRQLISCLPLLFILYIDLNIDMSILVSSAMLISAVIKLVITLMAYKHNLNEPIPKPFPTMNEIKRFYNEFKYA